MELNLRRTHELLRGAECQARPRGAQIKPASAQPSGHPGSSCPRGPRHRHRGTTAGRALGGHPHTPGSRVSTPPPPRAGPRRAAAPSSPRRPSRPRPRVTRPRRPVSPTRVPPARTGPGSGSGAASGALGGVPARGGRRGGDSDGHRPPAEPGPGLLTRGLQSPGGGGGGGHGGPLGSSGRDGWAAASRARGPRDVTRPDTEPGPPGRAGPGSARWARTRGRRRAGARACGARRGRPGGARGGGGHDPPPPARRWPRRWPCRWPCCWPCCWAARARSTRATCAAGKGGESAGATPGAGSAPLPSVPSREQSVRGPGGPLSGRAPSPPPPSPVLEQKSPRRPGPRPGGRPGKARQRRCGRSRRGSPLAPRPAASGPVWGPERPGRRARGRRSVLRPFPAFARGEGVHAPDREEPGLRSGPGGKGRSGAREGAAASGGPSCRRPR